MWHEARKQEKKIRGLLVDYQRRAQRRKDYYEKIRADPTQFLQLHGRQCKIHIDPGIAIAANSPATMMPWQGNEEIMIDRFDARAHLDFIREPRKDDDDEQMSYEERHLNYERYRILVQNEFLTISESKFLHQLYLEEKFGPVTKTDADDAKKKSTANAAIPYKYSDEDTIQTDDSRKYLDIKPKNDGSDESDEESEVDFDLSIDVSKIGTDQANELNTTAHGFGMTTNDFYSFLNNDLEEAENIQLARLAEEEKAMFAGRRSRRERRAFRLKALEGKALSPLSYATRKSPSYTDFDQLSSMMTSRSPTPENSGQVTYITSFGDEEPTTNDKSKTSTKSKTSKNHSRKKRSSRSRSPRRKSRSLSKGHSRRHRSRSRNKSVSPIRNNTQLPAAQKPPPVQRYYGRRGNDSSSELSISDDDDKDKNTNNVKPPLPDLSLSSSSKKQGPSDSKPTPQELMKRKMKVLLNKQYKADKKAQRERELKMEREQIEREEEIKELSLKMRRKRRQLRHPENSSSSSRSKSRSKSSSSSSSSSSSNYSRYRSRRRRSRSRSGGRRSRSRSGGHRSRSRSGGRRRSKSSDRRRRSRSDDKRWSRRSEERDRYRRDDRRDYDRRDDYRSRRSPERRDRRVNRRDSPSRKEIKQRESPIKKEIKQQRESPVRKEIKQREISDRIKKENVVRPIVKITYEASPKRYVSSTKVQSNLKPLVDYD
ncbi:CLK4-associating serine/arginine rich protein-like isoform X1 [Myzus persicae]|uniref:CLK4-associating serine/arginine rich protein-like isoform X1 n=1 Tax=Myzus persicae TaxID=13164 RepID=UPI000B931424|nr:CLK4-associating serine/arginine rich protein-like isoform X1 [Myzus persicae]XP_022179446.1 CLK4-associating serine/arginine rich protein-like isoform X1 [Myzus persicae]XP_022179447.1 CLK4-associating serine/arginine rich protein-like isoform X1 [Myzus persicae]XP_022179448.1 CLK4-associating serine/arginine rich protein-like isoform X1 [Myzus persicae]